MGVGYRCLIELTRQHRYFDLGLNHDATAAIRSEQMCFCKAEMHERAWRSG
jgi:hypothetical protein